MCVYICTCEYANAHIKVSMCGYIMCYNWFNLVKKKKKGGCKNPQHLQRFYVSVHRRIKTKAETILKVSSSFFENINDVEKK